MPGGGGTRPLRIWDLPTRLVHWLLVLHLPILWWTAENDLIAQHMIAGQVVLGLLLFRLIWGLVGSSTARFSSFVKGPRAIADYLAGRSEPPVGHNPLGALSVVAMLGLLFLQVGLGLFAGGEDEEGPLAYLVDMDLAEQVSEIHEAMFWVLLAVIALHVGAIFFYLFARRDNLLRPMLVGTREAPESVEEMRPAGALRFLLTAAASAALTLWIAGVLGR